MAASIPEVFVEIGRAQGWSTSSFTWTDITAYVENPEGIEIERGRADERSTADPATLTLTLNNSDGRFTPGLSSGAYYPDIKKGLPIRIRGRWPTGGAGTYYSRFVGFVDDWPIIWPNGATFLSTVTITASGTLARLGISASFKTVVEEEILSDDPRAFFPLSEEEGATQVGDISGNDILSMSIAQDGAGGTITFGADEGPKTDTVLAPVFDPIDVGNGKYLSPGDSTQVFVPDGVCHAAALECFFSTDNYLDGGTICQLSVGGTAEYIRLNLIDVGSAKMYANVGLYNDSGSIQTTNVSDGSSLDDGEMHHVVAWLEKDTSTTVKLKMKLDGGTTQTSSALSRAPSSGTDPFLPEYNRLLIGNGEDEYEVGGRCFQGVVADVAVHITSATSFDAARWVDHADAGLTGFNGETVEDRLTRYARWTGFPTSRVSAATADGTVGHIDTAGVAPLEAMRQVEAVDGGVLYDGDDGSLAYNAPDDRYGATSSFTLDAEVENIEGDIEFRLDDQFLTNEVTASRDEGTQIRVVDTSSQDTYGPYVTALDLPGASDDQVLAVAQNLVNRYAEPSVRVPRVSVNLYKQDSSLVASMLAADIGTRLTLDNLPTQAPTTTEDFFIEGIRERINEEEWIIQFDLSPADGVNVWLLGDANYGQLGDTTILAY